MDYDPPFLKTYSTLLQDSSLLSDSRNYNKFCEYCEFPLIDLGRLNLEREKCLREIREAARKWGFFQVVNHGVPQELLENLMCEQMTKVFHRPFATKSQENFRSNISASGSSGYRWGNPSAMNPSQLSWSEAFHVFLPDIATMDNRTNLRCVYIYIYLELQISLLLSLINYSLTLSYLLHRIYVQRKSFVGFTVYMFGLKKLGVKKEEKRMFDLYFFLHSNLNQAFYFFLPSFLFSIFIIISSELEQEKNNANSNRL